MYGKLKRLRSLESCWKGMPNCLRGGGEGWALLESKALITREPNLSDGGSNVRIESSKTI